jgi:general secretion pathway protein G
MAMRSKTHSRAGFSLVEIMVVIVIISILAGFVALKVIDKPGEARRAQVISNIDTIETALIMYKGAHSRLPSQAQGLNALAKLPTIAPIPANYPSAGYLDVPLDPWGNPYLYFIPGRQARPYEVVSLGADQQEGGEGEDADISTAD